MTDGMLRLAGIAEKITPPGAVSRNDLGFTLETGGGPVTFFATGGVSAAAYCRAPVAGLGGARCPESFAEAALRGNFFWRATGGAVLSLNEAGNAIYLTDRFDEGAFADETAFRSYLEDFLRTLRDWRIRLETCLSGKEAAV